MRPNSLASSRIHIISNHGFAEICHNTINNQKSLHATIPFSKGDVLRQFEAREIKNTPDYLTVQTGRDRHITLLPEFIQYINHSCDPNVFFDTDAMLLIALKDINVKDEFTFFYPSTEWDMSQPFVCFCGSGDCLQNIRGARYLTPEQVNHYQLTGFIRKELERL